MTTWHRLAVGDVTVATPPGWETRREGDGATIVMTETRGDHAAATIMVTIADRTQDESSVAWAQHVVASLGERIPRMRVIDLEDTEVDGRWARRVLSHHPHRRHGGLVLERWLVPDGSRGIALTCSVPTPGYDERADLFAAVAARLELGGSR